MTIVRRHHNSNFTVVPNAIFGDARLSIEAKGALGYLLSRPHDWTVRVVQLGPALGIGRDKAERIISELIAAGYVLRRAQQRTKSQQWGAADYVVLDHPTEVAALTNQVETVSNAAVAQPVQAASEPPCPEKPHTAEPRAENQGTYKEMNLQRERGRERARGERKTENERERRRRKSSTSLVSAEALQVADQCIRSIGHRPGALLNLSSLHYEVEAWLRKGHEPAAIVAAFVQIAANYGDDKPLTYFVKAINTALAKRDLSLATARTVSGTGLGGRNEAARNGGFIHHAINLARRATDG